MTSPKTVKTNLSVSAYIASVDDDFRRTDAMQVLEIMKQATGIEPTMWGSSIVGFGEYHYKSTRSSQEGDWFLVGFSPRKANLTIYITPGFDKLTSELELLGPHKTSVSCLYIKRLSDIDLDVLAKLLQNAVRIMNETNFN